MKRHGDREIDLEQMADHRMQKVDSRNKNEEIGTSGDRKIM
jgi:hypothetical protein